MGFNSAFKGLINNDDILHKSPLLPKSKSHTKDKTPDHIPVDGLLHFLEQISGTMWAFLPED
jgi:hypothetical protein